ncbi:PEF-CTERM sorting domain-containing protein [Methanolobus halotolerans]|uniref:PEF-CTERM protein sorting domain-containing protein n=1 Tax=Methanolobus halotolerans TaxID=2052935 RepID=A0A4E0Q777_9EURY|nr:PEF-CTERM sorting domain-containing protein [Methanolobus halotolerans]TGC10737.1 hypothetical protein CUN85_04535 [Methanolobus halotolerans]
MDRRLIIIPVLLFASVLLVSGLMNDDTPAPDIGAVDGGNVDDGPAQEEQDSGPLDEQNVTKEDEPEEELPLVGMGGSAKLAGSSMSAPEQPEEEEQEEKEEEKVDEGGNIEEGNEEGDNGNNSDNNEPCPGPEEIPEFPTIALPMLAIIGLAFIFRRR